MRRILLVTALAFSLPHIAAANTCTEIENDMDRLACYDKAANRFVAEKPKPAAPIRNWSVSEKKSQFKDTKDVFMMKFSTEPVSCGFLNQPQKLTLMLRCLENTTALFIGTHCHLASGFQGYGRVEYRFDDARSQTMNFDASTDNKALGIWSGGRSIPVIKSMFGKSEALFRFTPFNESPVTVRFDISNLEKEIAPLREACHW